jgi:hypothetical protein
MVVVVVLMLYTISARAFDPTGFDPVNGWVRTNQSSLEQLVSWNVTYTTSIPEPSTIFSLLALSALTTNSARKRKLKRDIHK